MLRYYVGQPTDVFYETNTYDRVHEAAYWCAYTVHRSEILFVYSNDDLILALSWAELWDRWCLKPMYSHHSTRIERFERFCVIMERYVRFCLRRRGLCPTPTPLVD